MKTDGRRDVNVSQHLSHVFCTYAHCVTANGQFHFEGNASAFNFSHHRVFAGSTASPHWSKLLLMVMINL